MPGKTTSTSSKPHERRTIQINGTLTALAMTLVFYILYNFVPIVVPRLPSTVDKLIYTLRLQTLPCLCLVLAISIVAVTRLYTIAVDPINGGGEHLVAFKVRFLTNTLEQFVVSFVGLFGRISFYIGYSSSYLKRTVGVVATFGVSLTVWCFNLYFIINDFIL